MTPSSGSRSMLHSWQGQPFLTCPGAYAEYSGGTMENQMSLLCFLKYLRWYIFLGFLLWELTAYAGIWSDLDWKKPTNSHLPVTSALLNTPMQQSMSRQQIIIMMQDCISPLTALSSSFHVCYHHFPSFGLTKQIISLSFMFACNKTQSTEAQKNRENKSVSQK